MQIKKKNEKINKRKGEIKKEKRIGFLLGRTRNKKNILILMFCGLLFIMRIMKINSKLNTN